MSTSIIQVKHLLLSDNEYNSPVILDEYINRIFCSFFVIWKTSYGNEAHSFMFERISTYSCPLLYTILLTFLFCRSSFLYALTSCQVLVGRLANSHSYIKLAGHSWDATLIKFKSNGLTGVWKINSTLITPGWEACTRAVAVEWKGKDGPRQAADCKSLRLGISSRVLEGVIVTLESS